MLTKLFLFVAIGMGTCFAMPQAQASTFPGSENQSDPTIRQELQEDWDSLTPEEQQELQAMYDSGFVFPDAQYNPWNCPELCLNSCARVRNPKARAICMFFCMLACATGTTPS